MRVCQFQQFALPWRCAVLLAQELLDPAKGLINPQDYSLSLQVTLSADPPHGVW